MSSCVFIGFHLAEKHRDIGGLGDGVTLNLRGSTSFLEWYRTFYIKVPGLRLLVSCLLMFEEEFGGQMHRYSMLVDRFGNRFEVIIEKRDEELCFTHGWPLRDVFGRHMYSNLCVSLSRSLFGRDEYPIPGEQICMPYRHDDRDFTHIFVVVLTELISTLDICKLFAKDATAVKLVDDMGFEWKCTVEYTPPVR
ncbi:hypothetical protein TSUD_397260 [Trifolium subterraneum]|uniref:Uncharacterized protein n=1 Tax=Trifolium subterraneum TaxID=3900 RepID=A0A2Z6P8H1_TRISU|nr:hypothetical protein TSUD_397260 [Trifolium subterraneum]